MTLLSIILALVFEQAWPLPVKVWVESPLGRLADLLEDRFNDGQYRHGAFAWIAGAGLPSLAIAGIYGSLLWFHPVAAVLFGIALLYLTMGFRQFSHFFTDIQLALKENDAPRARQLLSSWRGVSNDRLSSSEIARLSIEQALVASHRHVFAPLFWFSVLGPGGALLYRLSGFYGQRWGRSSPEATDRFGEFSAKIFGWLDWIPVRLTAAAFAVVGDFEDAVYCWRTQAGNWPDPASGILLASGGGALGIKLGQPLHDALNIDDRPELGLGDEVDSDHMQSAVGLVWRTLVLGVMLIALIWISTWVG